MQANPFELPLRPKLTEKDFSRISQYIQKHFGIKLPLAKLILVESRLIKRVSKLNIKSFAEYVNFIFSKEGHEEQQGLIDFISTNKTDFFREEIHFKFLENHIRQNKLTRPINIWSAACSSGEEPYTISMVLEDMKLRNAFDGNYSMLATDISAAILNKAIKGEYQEKSMAYVPKEFQKRYFTVTNGLATINASLRRSVNFKRFNLIEDTEYYGLNKKFEFIFCRNVLIYFDYDTQKKVIDNLIKMLAPEGILFLGHSETLTGKNFPVTQIQPTIYQKQHE